MGVKGIGGIGGIDASTTVRDRMFMCFDRRTEGVQGASGKPPASINVRQLGHKNSFARA